MQSGGKTCLLIAGLALAAPCLPVHAQDWSWISLGKKDAQLLPNAPVSSATSPQLGIEPSARGYRIALNLAGFGVRQTKVDSKSFTEMKITEWTTVREPGKPAVPVRTVMLEIPRGTTPSVNVAKKTEVPVRDMQVMPAQPPPPDVYPAPPPPDFQIDDSIYDSDDPFPADNVLSWSIVEIRDRRILTVHLAPIRVQPRSRVAMAATELEVDISLTSEVKAGEPAVLDAPYTDAVAPLPIYMILMDDQFANNTVLASLIDWKKRKGYDVRTVKTSDINASGAPSNSQIVAYMRNLAATNYPNYLLILGDHTEANGVAGAYFNTYTTDYHGYTDLDIACRTQTDWIPDLFYGRLPATNNAEASNMLARVYNMDRHPPTAIMRQRVCISGQIQDADDHNDVADRLFCETADLISSYFEQRAGFSASRAIVNPDGVTSNCAWNANSLLWNAGDKIGQRVFQHFTSVATAQARIIDEVNNGVALLQHRDHGYINGVGWGDPSFLYTHVRSIQNRSNLTAVFSINCNSGMYNYNSHNNFAKSWMVHTNGGAYAVFAPVDTSYSWLNDWMSHGFYISFLDDYRSFQNTCATPTWPKKLPAPGGTYGQPGSGKRLGEILNFGKMYMYEKYWADESTFRLFHLFGDPESWLHIPTPTALAVSHPSVVAVTNQNITINTGAAGCDVCIYSPALGIHQRITTTNTSAVFNISPSAMGYIYVTITKYGKLPYEGTINVGQIQPFWFRATGMGDSVMLRWQDPTAAGFQSKTVHIRSRTDAYPADTSDGSAVYTGTDTVCTHSDLTQGQPYYYTIWVSNDGTNFVEP